MTILHGERVELMEVHLNGGITFNGAGAKELIIRHLTGGTGGALSMTCNAKQASVFLGFIDIPQDMAFLGDTTYSFGNVSAGGKELTFSNFKENRDAIRLPFGLDWSVSIVVKGCRYLLRGASE